MIFFTARIIKIHSSFHDDHIILLKSFSPEAYSAHLSTDNSRWGLDLKDIVDILIVTNVTNRFFRQTTRWYVYACFCLIEDLEYFWFYDFLYSWELQRFNRECSTHIISLKFSNLMIQNSKPIRERTPLPKMFLF